jgi:hypothetical protein
LLAVYYSRQPWAAAVAKLLLASGADASATNKAGKTPMQCVLPWSDDEDSNVGSNDEDSDGYVEEGGGYSGGS